MMVEIGKGERELLFHIIQNGNIRKLTNFFSDSSDIDIDFTDASGKTPLICAVCYDEKDDVRTHMVRTLLRYGSDVNVQDMYGCTALMYSCMNCDCEDVTRLLTKKGNSNPNIQDNELNTAMMHAVIASNAGALQILVTSSATRSKLDLNLQNNQGLTALELAIKLKMGQCCKVLVQNGCADITQTKDLKGLRILLGTDVGANGREHSFVFSDTELTPTPRRNSTPLSTSSVNSSEQRCLAHSSDVLLRKSRNSVTTESSSMTPRRSSYSSTYRTHQSYDISWVSSPRKIRRALTPLFQDNSRIEEEEQNIFSHRTRLPSIPSGKRLWMVNSSSNFTTQSDDVNVA